MHPEQAPLARHRAEPSELTTIRNDMAMQALSWPNAAVDVWAHVTDKDD